MRSLGSAASMKKVALAVVAFDHFSLFITNVAVKPLLRGSSADNGIDNYIGNDLFGRWLATVE